MKNLQLIFEYFKGEPLIIQVVWAVSCILFIISIGLVIYLKFYRSHLRRNEKIVKIYREKYEQLLIAYLYAGNENEISSEQLDIINQLKNCKENKFKREIVVSTLLKLRNEISGEMADSIKKLYFQTKLFDYALINLKNKNWYVIAKGVRELTQFHVEEAHEEVIALANHPKSEVRKEVQFYLVSLFHFKGLVFLNDLKVSLSEWDQIQLLEVLQRFDNQEICDLVPWLKSENESVTIFALKLAKIYNQYEIKEVLIELLSHKSKKVRIELINVLSYLTIFEAKEFIKNTLNTRDDEEQIVFFQLFENMFESSDEDFILGYIHHANFEIKFLTLKILKTLNVKKFNNLELASQEPAFVEVVKFIERS